MLEFPYLSQNIIKTTCNRPHFSDFSHPFTASALPPLRPLPALVATEAPEAGRAPGTAGTAGSVQGLVDSEVVWLGTFVSVVFGSRRNHMRNPMEISDEVAFFFHPTPQLGVQFWRYGWEIRGNKLQDRDTLTLGSRWCRAWTFNQFKVLLAQLC